MAPITGYSHIIIQCGNYLNWQVCRHQVTEQIIMKDFMLG